MSIARQRNEAMVEWEPVSAQRCGVADAPKPSWPEARWRLDDAQFYWLATVRPDGRPHVMPILAVWLDGALHFCTSPVSRKGMNLAQNVHCVITVDSDDLHLVVEGESEQVKDERRLRRLAEAYATKYGWEVVVRDGAFHADGAPTAGRPPYEVYTVQATRAFAFGTDESFGATRWQF